MPIQVLTGQFPGIDNNLLVDGIENGAGWSPGGDIIVPLSVQPTITRAWTILAWSINFSGAVAPFNVPGPQQLCGQLGKLYGGLVTSALATQRQPTFQEGYFPANPTMTSLLWDGSQDPCFPWGSAAVGGFVATSTANVQSSVQQLPQPLLLAAGEQLGIGLWLTPSLAAPIFDGGGLYLAITYASYSITYQTGT